MGTAAGAVLVGVVRLAIMDSVGTAAVGAGASVIIDGSVVEFKPPIAVVVGDTVGRVY